MSWPAPMATTARPAKTTALIILVAGLVIRLVWAWFIQVVPISDSHAYDTFARVLVEHGVYGWADDNPTAYWAVGTSAVIALGYMVFGETYLVVVALNLVASLAMIWLTWRIAEYLFGAQIGLLAMALVAAWPNLILFNTVISSELFFIALSMAGVWFWLRRDDLGAGALLLSGLFLAAACYVRPIALLFPIVLWMATWPQGPRRSGWAMVQAMILVGMIVLCAMPWTMRNRTVIGSDAMISTNFGPNLWMGNNPLSHGGYMPLPPEAETMTEAGREQYLGQLARDYMIDNPWQTVLRTAGKALRLHERETIGVVWNEAQILAHGGGTLLLGLKLVSTGFWYTLLIGAVLGIRRLWRTEGWQGALFNPPMAIWGYVTAVHAVIVVEDRYHMPASPWIAMLAALALAGLLEARHRREGE